MKWVREDLNAKQLDKNAGQLEKVIEQIGRLKRAMFLPRTVLENNPQNLPRRLHKQQSGRRRWRMKTVS